MKNLEFYENQVLPDFLNETPTYFRDENDLLDQLKKAKANNTTILAYCDSADENTGELFLSFLDNSNIVGYVIKEEVTWKLDPNLNDVHVGRSIACVGNIIRVKVLDIEETENGMIKVRCSRKKAIEEIKDKYNSDIENGIFKEKQLVKGVITGMDRDKVFVDIGADVIAILGVADISRVYVKHPSDRLETGQVIDLAIKRIYPMDNNRDMNISLSRSLLLDGWESIDNYYKVGRIVVGRIKSYISSGVFIELNESFEGLAENLPYGKRYKYGDRVKVSIKYIDKKRKKIKLKIIENR